MNHGIVVEARRLGWRECLVCLGREGQSFRVEREVGVRPQELTQDCKLVVWAVFDWLLIIISLPKKFTLPHGKGHLSLS